MENLLLKIAGSREQADAERVTMITDAITTKLLKLANICIDADTQIRTAINEATVAEYAERMADGDVFPNPHVYFDGVKYYLADGFHRFHAFGRNELSEARFEVHKGTAIDARRFALSANGSNGLRMTNEDKRKAVAWGLELYPNKSSRDLAKICYVSHNFVETCRKQLSSDDSSKPRVGADGKERKPRSDKGTKVGYATAEAALGIEPEPPHITRPTIDDKWREATGMDSVPQCKAKPELTPTQVKLLEQLDVMEEDIKCLRDCIPAGECEPDAIGDVILNCNLTAKMLKNYKAEISI